MKSTYISTNSQPGVDINMRGEPRLQPNVGWGVVEGGRVTGGQELGVSWNMGYGEG